MIFEKPLRVGKRERYELDISNWLAGEPLVSATVSPDNNFASLEGIPDLTSGVIGFFLDGVQNGRCKIHVNYATATRTDCAAVTVIVLLC